MRRSAVAVAGAAGIAAALWLLSGLLNFAAAWHGTRWQPVIDLVLPPTVPSGSWQQPAPWGVLLPVLGALCLAGLAALAYAGLARWRGWRDASAGVRLLTAWFALVVLALLVAAVWTLGATIAVLSPNGFEWAFRSTQPGLLAGGVFGVVWGWAPALLLARVGPRAAAPRRPWSAAVLAIVAVLTVGAAVGVVVAQPAVARLARVAAGGTPDGRPTSTPTPTPTDSPAPPAAVAAEPVRPGADWCAPEATSLTVSGTQGALGHRALAIVLVNRSTQSCVVDGYPDVAFAGTDGNALDVTVEPGTSYLVVDPGPAAVTLAPGASALSYLSWDATGARTGTAVTLWAAAYAGADRAQLPIGTDITAASSVTVSAWAPADASG